MIGGEEITFETQTIDAPLTIDGENEGEVSSERGPLSAVHLSRHKWPGGLVNQDSGRPLTIDGENEGEVSAFSDTSRDIGCSETNKNICCRQQ